MAKYLLRRRFRDFFSWIARESESTSIIASTVWQIIEKFLRLCSAAISGILIARYLQPEQYGIYNYALAFTSFFVAVSSLGTSQIFRRELIKEPQSGGEIVSSAFFFRIMSGLLFFLLAIGTAFAFISDVLVRLLIVIFSLQMIFRSSEAIEFSFESKLKYGAITFSKSIASALATALIVVSVATEKSIIVLAVASCSEYLIAFITIISVYIYRRQVLNTSAISLSRMTNVLSDSWPLIFSGIAITVYMRIDQIMINTLVGSTELGLYSATVQLTEVFYLFPIAFIRSNFPRIVRLKEEGESAFYSNLQKLYNQLSLISYAFIVFVSIFSRELLGILYGSSYAKAAPILTLLIWSVLFVTLGTAQSAFMVSMNWTKIHLKTVLVASVVNVLLNCLLIPKHGAFGAAIATVFSYWVAVHGACFLFEPLRKTRNMITRSFVLLS
ncbi:MatE family [Synechococcus sp. PCC 7335]|uniref:flippase n=1 Tax=Synechococcus sp. (strain ATCC 29403 / PCC 7335) TaxID=91464 RepID=UPI00017EC78A|nr:flippase [Synechococcus sp. PCC 7335]EDX87349.1 MatE family [Synechococcus sp. PCC 7335]